MTITINGVEINLEGLPHLIEVLDQAIVIDKRQHVLRVRRYGKDMLIDDLTATGFNADAWRAVGGLDPKR